MQRGPWAPMRRSSSACRPRRQGKRPIGGERLVVDRHDHDLVGRRARDHGARAVLQHAVDARQRLGQRHHRDQRQQTAGEQQPVLAALAQPRQPRSGGASGSLGPGCDGANGGAMGDAAREGAAGRQGRPTGSPSLLVTAPPAPDWTTLPMRTRWGGENGPARPDASRACSRTK